MIHEKLMVIQQKLKAPKENRNDFGKYNYRSCSDILEAVKPFLEETNCTLTLTDDVVACEGRVYVKATATLTDCEIKEAPNMVHGTAYAREPMEKKGMDASQITGTASSYARKYALCGLLAIDDSKLEPVYDPDSNGHEKTTGGNGNYPKKQNPPTRKNPEPKKGETEPGVTYATAEERHRLIEHCKTYKIDMGWLAETVGIKDKMTAPQFAKAMGIVNDIIAKKESATE